MSWLPPLFHTPTPTERLAQEREEITAKVFELDFAIRMKEKEKEKERTHADNALGRGNNAKARRHFKQIAMLDRQITTLSTRKTTLTAFETRLQDAEASDMMQRRMQGVAGAMAGTNRHFPIERVRNTAQNLSRDTQLLRDKAEMTEEAIAFDDDEENDDEDDLESQVNQMMELALMQRLPMPLTGTPTTAALAAASPSPISPGTSSLNFNRNK